MILVNEANEGSVGNAAMWARSQRNCTRRRSSRASCSQQWYDEGVEEIRIQGSDTRQDRDCYTHWLLRVCHSSACTSPGSVFAMAVVDVLRSVDEPQEEEADVPHSLSSLTQEACALRSVS